MVQVGNEQDEENEKQVKCEKEDKDDYDSHVVMPMLNSLEYHSSGSESDYSGADGEDACAPKEEMAATWDLLDPFLFPIIYESTLTLRNGEFEEVPCAPESREVGIDQSFCWLPSEFKVSEDGKSTKILSYINNLSLPGQDVLMHPILENVFTKLVPSFNHLLADLAAGSWRRKRCQGRYPLFTMDDEPFATRWKPPYISALGNIQGKTLAVVTRMVEIRLTPAEPAYNSHDWHVDGVAVCLKYLSGLFSTIS